MVVIYIHKEQTINQTEGNKMEGYTVIRKENKVFIKNEFWGEMMVYGIKSHKPYVKKLGSKFYITGDLAVQVYEA